jgi:hypothetical protein
MPRSLDATNESSTVASYSHTNALIATSVTKPLRQSDLVNSMTRF